jgi:hypothetical protein
MGKKRNPLYTGIIILNRRGHRTRHAFCRAVEAASAASRWKGTSLTGRGTFSYIVNRRGGAGVRLARRRLRLGGPAAVALLCFSSCAVRRTTRVTPLPPPVPPSAVSLSDLAARIDVQSKAIRTMTATVSLEPTAGSVYTGVIKEYHDVRAFVLLDGDQIRMVGQAPVVRTTIFDMASNGTQFRLSIPPKRKFIVGSTTVTRPAKNSLENLRPQHLLQALRIPPLGAASEKYFLNQERDDGRAYDVVNVVREGAGGELHLTRRVWFDAASLEITRTEFYDAEGAEVEDVRYQDYQDFGGIHYPAHIDLSRPADDYSMAMTIEKATFNQPIAPEKFDLKQPPGSELVELGATEKAPTGGPA